MKKINFIFSILTFISTSCNANWYELNTNGQVISYSRIAKEGKISVFILSTNWCSPCKALKHRLQDTPFDKDKIDFYYVNMSGDMKYEQLKHSNGYQIWRKIEQINSWPTVYIAAQTTNIVSSFSAEEEPYPYDKVVKITKDLIEDGKTFDESTMYKGKIKQISESNLNETNQDKSEMITPKERLPNETPKNSQPAKEKVSAIGQSNAKYKFRIATVSTKPSLKKFEELKKYGTIATVQKKKKWIIYLEDVDAEKINEIANELAKMGYADAVLEQ